MIPGLLLSFREGLEAALIIGVLLGALKKMDRQEFKSAVWAGAISAILASLAAGMLIQLLGSSFEGRTEEIFEGITMLLAAGVLTWVVLWMQRQAHTMNTELESQARRAVFGGSRNALFALAFLAVIREGIELALILTAASFTSNGSQVVFGTILGLIASVLTAWLLFNRLIQLNMRNFFMVTSIILVLFAAGLVSHGIHELNEVGWIPAIIEHVWDINPVLDENSFGGEILKTLFGYNGNPSLSEVLAYGGYFVLLALITRQEKTKAQVPATS